MVSLPAIDRKMLRDLWGMRGQALAIVFVMLSGVATYVSMTSVMDTLQHTQARYYEEYAFADGFAALGRAPESAAERLREVPGIRAVQTRVTALVNLEVAGYREPVSGLLVSIPGGAQPALNRLYLREGRLPAPDREDEVALNEVFAEAHGLRPDDTLAAVINGRRRTLRVAGIALSPEHLMQVQPGVMFPDPERFGVLWMNRAALAAAMDLQGAFNDVAFSLAPDADEREVIARVDRLLEPYGCQGAFGRADQLSHRMITEEFRQLRGTAQVLPVIFLAVAAFLMNVVVTRLIGLQREQIGILKAFGYRNRDVGWHYVKLVLVIAAIGAAGGTALGVWAGGALAEVYLEYFRFPFLDYTLPPSVVAAAVLLTTGAALAGVLRAVRRAVRLPPATAMQPPPPPVYRKTAVERLGIQRFLDQPTRMILRNLERQPKRALVAILGVSSACAILVMGLFFVDSIDHIIDVQYGLAQRETMTVSFIEASSVSTLHELAAMRGVFHAEPFRMVPVRLRHGHRSYDTAIEGIPAGAYLRRVIDTDLNPVPIPAEGLVLTERLGERLGVRPGDTIEVEVREGRRRVRRVPVSGFTEQYLGLGTYMEIEALGRLVGGGAAYSGAYLLTDRRHDAELLRALQDRPRVAGVLAQERALESYMENAENTLLVFTFVLSLFAGVIAFGVVYNNARISLSERDRELASLRVLGLTRGEVAFVLLGETGLLALLAIPIGIGLGAVASHAYVGALETDLYKIPAVLTPRTYAIAACVVLGAAAVSAAIVRHRIHRLDLIGVLKTRE